MRGDDRKQGGMWSYLSPEAGVSQDHPLRPIREMVDRALIELSPRFSKLYSTIGRPSIPPEQLLRALVLQLIRRPAATLIARLRTNFPQAPIAFMRGLGRG